MTLHAPSRAAIEHLDRGPLDRRELAAIVARDIPPGSYVKSRYRAANHRRRVLDA